MPTTIAETACVDPRAELDEDVEIGPYCVVGSEARIGRASRLLAHVCVMGASRIGVENTISPFAVIGGDPQDPHYRGRPTAVEIGDRNVIREGVTVNRASDRGDGVTRIGSDNVFMAGVHIAHDCIVEDSVIIANGTMLGAFVRVEAFANLSGGVAVHPYATVGGLSFVGGQSRIFHDVPRYMMVDGNPARVRCINIVGLKRHGVEQPGVAALHEAHRLIYRAKSNLARAVEVLESRGHLATEARRLIEFIELQQEGRHGRARERLRMNLGTTEAEHDRVAAD